MNLHAMQEMQETPVWFLGQKCPLEKVIATHSSILAWKIPWTEEPGGLYPIGLQRVGYNLATRVTLITALELVYPFSDIHTA